MKEAVSLMSGIRVQAPPKAKSLTRRRRHRHLDQSSRSPAAGTTVVSSPRAVPSAVTVTPSPRLRSSRPVAINGEVWPAVPPPASTTEPEPDVVMARYGRGWSATRRLRSSAALAASPSSPAASGPRVLGVRRQAGPPHREQIGDQCRAAVGQQRQRHTRDRKQPQYHGQVDQRLHHEPGGDTAIRSLNQ